MWCRTSKLVLLAAAATALGCGSGPQIDLCVRGDADDVRRSMEGGTFELSILNSAGFTLETIEVDADGGSGISFQRSDEAASIVVVGKTVNGGEVARGDGDFIGDGTCVCIALSGQFDQVCEGVACTFDSGDCAYSDAATGGPVGVRTLVLGEGANADAISDAWIDGFSQSLANGGDTRLLLRPEFGVDEPARALVRADMSRLPRETVIVSASLTFTVGGSPSATSSLNVFRVLEGWDEGSGVAELGCPNWTCRTNSETWVVPGVDYESENQKSRELEPSSQAVSDGIGPTLTIDLTELAQVWVTSPPDNFGALLTVLGEQRELVSSEGVAADRPRLTVDFRVE